MIVQRHSLNAAFARLALLLAAFVAAPWAQGKTERFELDPVHTRIAFQVSHAGFSNQLGTFSGSTGTLLLDPDDWSTAQLEVHIPIDSLDLGNAKWREKILDRTFLDSSKYPQAHFVSTKVEPLAGQQAQVTGDLTLHGETHPVTLQVTLNALERHPLTFKRTAGFSVTGSLSRAQFGMDNWKNLVGDEVKLIIEAEAVLDKNAEPANGVAR